MTKLFAVLVKDFEYNDEFYSPGDGGRPKKLFRSKEKAEAYATALTVDDFRKIVASNANARWKSNFIPFDTEECDLFDFRGAEGKILDEVLAKYGLPTSQSDDRDAFYDFTTKLGNKLVQITNDDLSIILGGLQNPMYEVYEVEADEEV